MFCFLETDVIEQKKCEKRIQTSVDKTVNDLRYEIKFESSVKDKKISEALLFCFRQKYIFFLETYFFKVSKNLIASAFFFAEAETKKHRYALAKASNLALVKLTNFIIKNDYVIICALFFYK